MESAGKTANLASDSAIGLHILRNPACAQHYDDSSRLSILVQGSSAFHLPAFEASFIKTSNPASADIKEFVYSLKIVCTNNIFSRVFFQPIRARLFHIAASLLRSSFLRFFLASVRQKAASKI